MINKYRKKPVVIEAIQFTRHNWSEVKTFTHNKAYNFAIPKCVDCKAYCMIETLEGNMEATEFDYIIRGIDGEFYACKHNIFNKTYEDVHE